MCCVVLVMLRPVTLRPDIEGARSGKRIAFRNIGNTNVELIDGRQCDAQGANCKELPAKRLYPGARWEQSLEHDTPVDYMVTSGAQVVSRTF